MEIWLELPLESSSWDCNFFIFPCGCQLLRNSRKCTTERMESQIKCMMFVVVPVHHQPITVRLMQLLHHHIVELNIIQINIDHNHMVIMINNHHTDIKSCFLFYCLPQNNSVFLSVPIHFYTGTTFSLAPPRLPLYNFEKSLIETKNAVFIEKNINKTGLFSYSNPFEKSTNPSKQKIGDERPEYEKDNCFPGSCFRNKNVYCRFFHQSNQ